MLLPLRLQPSIKIASAVVSRVSLSCIRAFSVASSSASNCGNCGNTLASSETQFVVPAIQIVTSSRSFDCDVDGRPHDLAVLARFLQHCKQCDYAAEDIRTVPTAEVKSVLSSPASDSSLLAGLARQTEQDSVSRHDIAKAALTASRIAAATQQHALAGWHTLYAFWVLEDIAKADAAALKGLRASALDHFTNAVRTQQSLSERMPAVQLSRFFELNVACRRRAPPPSSQPAPVSQLMTRALALRSWFPHKDDFGGPAKTHRLWRNYWDELFLTDLNRRSGLFADAQMHAGIAAEALGLLFRIWIQKRKLELQFGEEPVVASADPLEVPAPTMNPATGATATKGASPFSVDLQYAHEMLELQTYLIKSCKSADRAPRVTLAQDIDEPFAI